MSTHRMDRSMSLLRRTIGLLRHQRPPSEVDDPRARSWAREVRSLADVPPAYKPFFAGLQPHEREPFPYTVLTPTFRGGHGRAETERLLCIAAGAVHVLELVDGHLRTRRYSPECTSFLERGSILLHAWITIHGEDQQEALSSTTVRFNSVTDHVMAPFVEVLRPAVPAASRPNLQDERSRFDFLAATHFKFMSYGQNSLRPGDAALQILLQPQIRRELLGLFGYSLSRLVCPAHLAILTPRELILIRDDESQRWLKGSSHGAIWTYIPRARITDAAVKPAEDDRHLLSIGVPGERRIEALFESSQQQHLQRLLDQLRLRRVDEGAPQARGQFTS